MHARKYHWNTEDDQNALKINTMGQVSSGFIDSDNFSVTMEPQRIRLFYISYGEKLGATKEEIDALFL
jgi:hypothetical protein